MEQDASRISQAIALLLAATVVTQIVYIVKSAYGIAIPGPAIWSVEAALFLGISVLGLVAAAHRGPYGLGWVAIALGGLLNVHQVGIGLAMFGPLEAAGEPMAPVYEAVAAGAFYLYFAGKLLFGVAGVVLGLILLSGAGIRRIIGGAAMLTGLAAMLVNLGAIATGMGWLYQAGAAGTVATLMLAVALLVWRGGTSPARS